jgi:hypothetical protein
LPLKVSIFFLQSEDEKAKKEKREIFLKTSFYRANVNTFQEFRITCSHKFKTSEMEARASERKKIVEWLGMKKLGFANRHFLL